MEVIIFSAKNSTVILIRKTLCCLIDLSCLVVQPLNKKKRGGRRVLVQTTAVCTLDCFDISSSHLETNKFFETCDIETFTLSPSNTRQLTFPKLYGNESLL